MAQQNVWRRLIAAINREYERRIRAASLVNEYGARHHGHTHHDDTDAEVAVIANVPRGTRVERRQGPEGESTH